MNPEELAEAISIILGYYLPHQQADGDDELYAYGGKGLSEASELWNRLRPILEGTPSALQATMALGATPGEATINALRAELETLFTEDSTLARELSRLVSESVYASLVGMRELPVAGTPLSTQGSGQMTSLELRKERSEWGCIFLVFIAVTIALSVINAGTGGQSTPLLFLAALVYAFFVFRTARRIGLPQPVWAGIASLIPGGRWITMFGLAAYRPPHLTQRALEGHPPPERGELAPWVRWVTLLGVLPLLLAVVMTIINPSYMGQLFIHPFGIGIAIALIVGLPLSAAGFWFGFWQRKARSGLALTFLSLATAFDIASIYLVLLGPAMVAVLDQDGIRGLQKLLELMS